MWQITQPPARNVRPLLLSAEASAREILNLSVHRFQRLAGEALKTHQLHQAWLEQHYPLTALEQGLAYAQEKEWLDPVHDGVRLTKAGVQVATRTSIHRA